MKKNQLGPQNKIIIKIIFFVTIIIFLFASEGINNYINNGVEAIFTSIKGSVKPDSNIVLITIIIPSETVHCFCWPFSLWFWVFRLRAPVFWVKSLLSHMDAKGKNILLKR